MTERTFCVQTGHGYGSDGTQTDGVSAGVSFRLVTAP